jgi:hypothetical protein
VSLMFKYSRVLCNYFSSLCFQADLGVICA